MEGMTVKEVLAFAKILEENSNKFYINASMTTKLTNAKKFLGELAKEELKHRDLIANLEKKIDSGENIPKITKKIENLSIADFTVSHVLADNADFIDILVVAINKEKEAIKVYSTFADSLEDSKVKELFSFLINEEKKHLRKFEEDYDDYTDEMSHDKVRELIKKMSSK
jgi:rubrerythrin